MGERRRSTQGKQVDITAGARRLLELKADALQALGHPARLMILETLRNGERCVCEIGPVLGLRQPNVSQHLSILRAAGLVAWRRDGTRVLYRAIDPAVFQVIDLIAEVVRRQGHEMAQAIAQAT